MKTEIGVEVKERRDRKSITEGKMTSGRSIY
jgi:hypothetical protein